MIVHIMLMCCPLTLPSISPPLPARLHPPPRRFGDRQPVSTFSDWVYICDYLGVFFLWTTVGPLAEGSLVAGFVLCLNYFPS